jgi:hypothetical protein
MHDNVFATKRFTRNAAQQAVKQTLYQLSDFWKQNTRCNAAKRAEKMIKQHIMLFLPSPTRATAAPCLLRRRYRFDLAFLPKCNPI